MADPIKPLISAEDIQRRVAELAAQIDRDYAGSPLTVMGILNGSFIFLSDLVRNLKTQCVIDFVAAASYGSRTRAGDLRLLKRPQVPLKDRRILIVDDILDTGNTLHLIRSILLKQDPLDIRICVMLSKQCPRKTDVHADYIGFEIPDRFVVGYGLDDLAGHCRHLSYIGVLEEQDASPRIP